MNFSILGTGSALPALTVTNHDLAAVVDTSDEWILQKTGIKERHILSIESLTDLSVAAAENALKNADLHASEIDLLIVATLMGDTCTPSAACVLAERIGASCPAFDLNAACSGFIYALDIAAGYYARKRVKNILIVCGEQLSRHVDWTDRGTCVLFGDGAGAVVLGEGDDLLSIRITATPNYGLLYQNHIGGASPFNKRDYGKPYLQMNGQEVYKFAVQAICADLQHVMDEAKISETQIKYFFLHQANKRIIDAAVTRLGFSKDKFPSNIERVANVSAASVLILLDEANRAGLLRTGDILAMSSFGAGLTTGAAVLLWSKQ